MDKGDIASHTHTYTYMHMYIDTHICLHEYACKYMHWHMVEYYSAMRNKKILSLAPIVIAIEDIMLSEVMSDIDRQILYNITHMWNVKTKLNS